MEPELNDLVFKFQERLKVLNRSSDTISNYLHYLKEYLESIQSCNIKKITKDDIENYIFTLYNRSYTKAGIVHPYTNSTISMRVRSIKRFFEYLEYTNVIFINPTEYIKEPKKERLLPKNILTPEEAKKILNIPNLGTPLGIRDRTILEIFYSTGIRIRELTNLTIFDVDLQGGYLRVNKGKGSKDRVIPIGKHSIRFLREYISKIRPRLSRFKRSGRDLFISHKSNKLTASIISIMVRSCVKESGINKIVTAHTFRHTFATQLVKNGADIRAVQKMMGHVSLQTTQIYTKLAGTKLKKDHQKTHPREKEKDDQIKPNIQSKIKTWITN